MHKLTKEQVELLRTGLLASEWCGYSKRGTVNALCDLALQSLSQESVRSEALPKAAMQEAFEKWWNDQEAFALSFTCKGTAWNAWQAALQSPARVAEGDGIAAALNEIASKVMPESPAKEQP